MARLKQLFNSTQRDNESSSQNDDDEVVVNNLIMQVNVTDGNFDHSEKDEYSSISQVLESPMESSSDRLVRFSSLPKTQMFQEKSFESLRNFDILPSKSPHQEIYDSSIYTNKTTLTKQNQGKNFVIKNDMIDDDGFSKTIEFRHSTTQYTGYNVLNEILHDEPIDIESVHNSVRTHKDIEALLCSEEELIPLNKEHKLGRNNSSRLSLKLAAIEKSRKTKNDDKILIEMASIFLSDYESGRPCSLPTCTTLDDINSSLRLTLYRIRHSLLWMICQRLAILALFLSSGYEGFSSTCNLAVGLSTFFLIVFGVDLFVLRRHNDDSIVKRRKNNIQVKRTSSTAWTKPMLFLIISVFIQTILNIVYINPKLYNLPSSPSIDEKVQYQTQFTSLVGVVKPIALFYLSKRARDALEALKRIIPLITKVILMELFVILSFATVACHLFSNTEQYENLSISFLSLFQLSTTVVNPSIWMSVYHEQRTSALFFILFIVFCVFYLHSLVLSIVYQLYIQAVADIRDLRNHDKEEALKLSFFTLQKLNYSQTVEGQEELVKTKHLREMFQILRPHYGPTKILALTKILDPTNSGTIGFTSFRRKIPKVLLTSLRSIEKSTHYSVTSEVLTIIVAIVNLLYVLTFSSISDHTFRLKEDLNLHLGAIVTILCTFELALRLNPFYRFSQSIKSSKPLDGLAFFASTLSLYGVVILTVAHPYAESYILIGRAIDMIRVLRYFSTFNSITQRSIEAGSTLVGPLALIIAWMHVFVYFGMLMWRGSLRVGHSNGDITPLYDLNNFNSYTSGFVTMFQILVVNDWQAIANVFLFGDKNSSPPIVWTFFIISNLTGVTILSVLTAFFIGSFTMKVDGDSFILSNDDHTFPQASVRISPYQLRKYEEIISDSESETSYDRVLSSPHEYNIFERQGYSQMLNSLIGDKSENDVSRDICYILELFERLTPGVEKVGYLICCQKTGDRFGNRRFLSLTQHYINEDDLHHVITEMITELNFKQSSSSTAESKTDFYIQRTYSYTQDDKSTNRLVLMASDVPQIPNIAMFTARHLKITD